ncbi:hypothetical protein [Streptomyces sp. NBC_00316]|uniref:hypothetical protein n=1 Tax=Streptomyces sp. NBC_00316 TaxID=2975710 RepID=UPI003FA774D2
MHDQTALKTEGIEDLLSQFLQVELSLDSGYQSLAKLGPKRIVVPPPKPGQAASADEITVYQRAHRHQSSERICVEHAIAEIKTWRVLKRYHGKREHLAPGHRQRGPRRAQAHRYRRLERHGAACCVR